MTTGIAVFWDTVTHESVHVTQLANSDAQVAVAAATPWANGWSWNAVGNDNHWGIGADAKPGVPTVDDDANTVVDDLLTTGTGELGRRNATDDVQAIPQGSGLANQTCVSAGTNLITPRMGDDVIDGFVITTGNNGICESPKVGNDTQIVDVGKGPPNEVCVSPGGDGTLETVAVPDDSMLAFGVVTGNDGICNTTAAFTDVQVIPVGQGKPNFACVAAGTNLVTTPQMGSDDMQAGTSIHTGANGICATQRAGFDIQDIPVGQGSPNQTCITPGADTVLQTSAVGDDAVAGANIHSGANGICQATVGYKNGSDDVDLDTIAPPSEEWPDAFGVPPPHPYAGGYAVEHQAYESEPDDETAFARHDWGDPGKNHRTIDNYND
jgi:hypothetical protein